MHPAAVSRRVHTTQLNIRVLTPMPLILLIPRSAGACNRPLNGERPARRRLARDNNENIAAPVPSFSVSNSRDAIKPKYMTLAVDLRGDLRISTGRRRGRVLSSCQPCRPCNAAWLIANPGPKWPAFSDVVHSYLPSRRD